VALPAKMAEQIKVLFGGKFLGPKDHCIRWGFPISHGQGEGRGFNAAIAKLL